MTVSPTGAGQSRPEQREGERLRYARGRHGGEREDFARLALRLDDPTILLTGDGLNIRQREGALRNHLKLRIFFPGPLKCKR